MPNYHKSYKIEDLQKEAIERNGICLSKKYYGALKNHEWKCNICDHKWKASWSGINNNGSWCPKCSWKEAGLKSRKFKIGDLQKHAKNNNGKLISKEYTIDRIKVEWFCNKHNFNWFATWDKIKRGRWCPKCAREKIKAGSLYTIEEIKEIAKKYNGELLSKEYLGINKLHKFKCANNHIFLRKPERITKSNPLQNTWCTKCKSRNHSEDFCRAVAEIAFKKEFNNGYPFDWLVTSSGRKMQLDGYNSELKLAFEYQGVQHKKIFKNWNQNKSSLEKRIKDDYLKKSLCKKNGIQLVTINDFGPPAKLKITDLIRHVTSAFKKDKIFLPKIDENKVLKKYYEFKISIIKDLKKKAFKFGLILKSKIYLGMNTRCDWECKKCKYKWKSSLSSIFYSNSRCPSCMGNAKHSLDVMKKLAKSKGGECISKIYKNIKTKLTWKCGVCKNEWKAEYTNIRDRIVKGKKIKGSWCPKCALKKRYG